MTAPAVMAERTHCPGLSSSLRGPYGRESSAARLPASPRPRRPARALVERPAGQPAISDQPEGEGGRRTRLPEAPHNSVAHPNARLLASRIENAELVTFPGLGHLFFWEDPGAFAAAVTTFLRRQDGSR